MRTILEIKDIESPEEHIWKREREAARGIFLDEDGLMPLMHIKKFDYHKLPGGGVDENEDYLDAIHREMKEETGCEIEISGEIGKVVEYRSVDGLYQISYCFFGKVVSKGEPDLTEKEKSFGFEVLWVTPSEALQKIENDDGKGYEQSFIKRRDSSIIKEYLDLIK